MHQLRSSAAARRVAFVLCTLLSCLAFWSTGVTLASWDDLWSGGNYYDSYSILEPTYRYRTYATQAMDYYQKKQWSGSLTYSDGERYDQLMDLLDPAKTNFRYQIHDESGLLISDNLGGAELRAIAGRIEMNTFTTSTGEALYRRDYTAPNPDGEGDYLMAYVGDNFVRCEPASALGTYNQYGWRSDGAYWSGDYDAAFDTRIQTEKLVLECGVLTPLRVQDSFWSDQKDYVAQQRWLPGMAVLAFVSVVLSAVLIVFLARNAGRRQDGSLGAGWQERIPFDLYLLLDALLVALIFEMGDAVAVSFNRHASRASVVGLGLFSILMAVVVLSCIMTLAIRLRSHTLVKSSLLGGLWRGLWRGLRRGFSGWPMLWRTLLLFGLYLGLSALALNIVDLNILLWPALQIAVLWLLCRWVKEWRGVREGARRIAGGETEFQIDTKSLYPDLREHAEQLNNMGGGMSRAVEEQLKGERFKAELITNVSHDLKTPLTSIINYVDLLKKTDIQDPTALEYIEVLERKSQRLKKLTEDLVEASKASTGNLTVNQERLGFTQLLSQALGEYEEKFTAAQLSLVSALPEEEVYVQADGRHLWRVLDNLLGNCVKYALPGTRVYLEVRRWDGRVTLSIKNVSQSPLNIPPDQLMERFVRGDEARLTEGSGLGLSIARSLTELQGGTFRLDIDGDLFKAWLSFAEYREPAAE